MKKNIEKFLRKFDVQSNPPPIIETMGGGAFFRYVTEWHL